MPIPLEDRRSGPTNRRSNDRRVGDMPVVVDARRGSDRRSRIERRLDLDSAPGQVNAALTLLTHAVESGTLGDYERRLLGSAILRLRFALDTFETK